MPRLPRAPTVFALLGLLAGALHPLAAQSYEDVAGGWIITRWTSADGAVNDDPERGLMIFTRSGQYSMTYVNQNEPRALLPAEPTDADRVAAFVPFIANAGRYRIEGGNLIYEAWVAKNPNYMQRWDDDEGGNEIVVKMNLEDHILTLEWVDGRRVTLWKAPDYTTGG